MSAPRKFATLTADALLRRSVTPEMERAAVRSVAIIADWWSFSCWRR